MKTDRIVELTRLIEQRMTELETMKTKVQSEGRHTTPEERTRAEELLNDVKTFTEELKLEQRELDIRGGINESLRDPVRPGVDTRDERQRQYAEQGIVLPPKEMRFNSLGEQMRAMATASRPGGLVDRRLVRAVSGASEGVPSDGGFLVQQDFNSEIMRRAYQRSPVLSRVRKLTISGNANSISFNGIAESSRVSSIWGGIIMYWLGEGGDKSDTHPKFEKVELNLKKIAGLFYATDELIEDASLLSGLAEEGFAEALDVELERVIIRGAGAGQPLGIMNSACLISVAAENNQAASTIVYENIMNMWAQHYSQANPATTAWVYSKSCFPQLASMYVGTGTSGQPVFTPPGGATANPYGSIYGAPLLPIENCSALGTTGDLILCDFSQYVLAQKNGPQFASSIHVRFTNDETVFRLVFRCDGQPTWSTTLTPKDNSSAVSPFVCLATRS